MARDDDHTPQDIYAQDIDWEMEWLIRFPTVSQGIGGIRHHDDQQLAQKHSQTTEFHAKWVCWEITGQWAPSNIDMRVAIP